MLPIVTKRLQKELLGFQRQQSQYPKWRVNKLTDAQFYIWLVRLKGPVNSLYEKGTFDIRITIPELYPMQPPKLKFLTKIFHPQISTDGELSIDILNVNWSPALTIRSVLITVSSTLKCPSYDDFMNEEAANMRRHNPKEFERRAKQEVQKYASNSLRQK